MAAKPKSKATRGKGWRGGEGMELRTCSRCNERFSGMVGSYQQTCSACDKELNIRTVLGIDQSLANTGVVVLRYWENGRQPGDWIAELVEHRTLKTPTGMRTEERAVALARGLEETILRWDPCEAAMEGYAYGASNALYATALGEIGMTTKLMVYKHLRVFPGIINIGTLKLFVAHNGRATKPEMMAAVKESWGWDAPNEHEADAYGLARLALAFAPSGDEFDAREPEWRQEILQQLRPMRHGEVDRYREAS